MASAQEQPARGNGRFVTFITHPVTGKKIYAKDFGKRAFFIPESSDDKKEITPQLKGSSSTSSKDKKKHSVSNGKKKHSEKTDQQTT